VKTKLNRKIAKNYSNQSQIIRVLTEDWVKNAIYCPNCGHTLYNYENNKPVADFYCKKCFEDYELKSKKDSMGNKVLDGAYATMLERLRSSTNPNFLFLNYDVSTYKIKNFVVIPKHFFTSEIIIPRKKGLPNRPDYIMCSIDLTSIPNSGKIFYIKEGHVNSKKEVLNTWKNTLFLREVKKDSLKGWILDVMNCVDKLNKSEFSLQEIYAFENILAIKYPNNKHIKDKIRQQLQFLRDNGYLEFLGNGKYKLI
jgi:type II restriction enzyme